MLATGAGLEPKITLKSPLGLTHTNEVAPLLRFRGDD